MMNRLFELGGERPAIFDAEAERGRAAPGGGAASPGGLALAAVLVGGLLLLGWLDGRAAPVKERDAAATGLADRDYRRLPPDLRACFTRIGNRGDWQMLDRCRAKADAGPGEQP